VPDRGENPDSDGDGKRLLTVDEERKGSEARYYVDSESRRVYLADVQLKAGKIFGSDAVLIFSKAFGHYDIHLPTIFKTGGYKRKLEASKGEESASEKGNEGREYWDYLRQGNGKGKRAKGWREGI
jgi:hypothetical protein